MCELLCPLFILNLFLACFTSLLRCVEEEGLEVRRRRKMNCDLTCHGHGRGRQRSVSRIACGWSTRKEAPALSWIRA